MVAVTQTAGFGAGELTRSSTHFLQSGSKDGSSGESKVIGVAVDGRGAGDWVKASTISQHQSSNAGSARVASFKFR